VPIDYTTPPRSELKLQILLSLLKGDQKLAALKAEIGTRETTILHALKNLEELNLTTKSGGVCSLTSLGVIEAQIFGEYSSAADAMKKLKDFWLPHDVRPIPPHLLLRLGSLRDSTLVRAENLALNKVHENFMQVLLTSETIKGISPIFHLDYVTAFRQLLSQGKPVELILTSDVFKETLASAEKELIKQYITQKMLKLFLRDDIKVASTVTKNSFSLGLFKLSGEYDYSMDLISLSREAVEWGEDLFRYYLKGSSAIEPETLS
jgi:predicted transcriptional regulator